MASAQAKGGNAEETKNAQFFCRTCHRSFGRRYHLERHLVNTPCSGKPPGCFPCDTCGKIFPTEAKLQSHARNHGDDPEGVKRFACGQCGRRFWSHSLLRIHSRQHTGERPFPCPECPKGFVSLGSLNKHRLCHAQERPHACPYCPARFTLKGTLNRHLPLHTGIRPHKCPHCSKEFVQAVALKSHLFSHTGQDGFRCTVCGRVFSRKTRMQEHVRTVHEKQHSHACNERARNERVCNSELGHDADQHFPCEQKEQQEQKNTAMIKPQADVENHDTSGTSEPEVPGGGTVSMDNSNDSSTAVEDMCHDQQPAEHPSHLLAGAKQVCSLIWKQGAEARDGSIQESIESLSNARVQRSVTLSTSDLETAGQKWWTLGTGTADLRSCASATDGMPSVKEQSGHETKSKSVAPSVKTTHPKDRMQEDLCARIEELLCVLVEKPILMKLGWPGKSVNEVLEAVIRHCGCSPSKYPFNSPLEELRENCKVLFVNVLEDDVAEKLLNNEETVDAVLGKVLELARL